MENYRTILARITENRKEAERLEKEVHEMPYSKRTEAAIVEKAVKAENLKIENKYLKDNARRAYIAEKLPEVVKVFAKYNGKPYGPKTAEKISTEIKETLACHVYISTRWGGDELNFVPLNEQGFNSWIFNHDDLELATTYNKEEQKHNRLLEDNKINLAGFDTLYLTHCGEYIEDTAAAAQALRNAVDNAKTAFMAYEKAQSELNAVMPSGIDHLYVSSPSFYKIF